MKLRRLFSFPLLGKELIERAARPQTFWMRVVFGGLLLLALWFMRDRLVDRDGLLRIGRGDRIASALYMMLLAGIFLCLPPLMAGLIAAEKERDSISALMLTDMSPTSILLQKYIAGLLPMLNFLLIAAPLGAVAYSLGGVDPANLVVWGISLAAAVLQVGAISLLASCYFRTTGGALVGSYFAAFGSAAVVFFPYVAGRSSWSPYREEHWLLNMTPWKALFARRTNEITISQNLEPLIPVVIFLLLARFVFVRRAFLPPRPVVATAFRRWDVLFEKMNRVFGDVRFGKVDRGELPQSRPVWWREMQRTALRRPQHVVRLLLPYCIPAVFGIGGLAGADITACIAMLVLLVAAVTTIVNERTNQTLETLLTTPISTRDILLEKYAVVRRYGRLLFIPVALSLVLFEFLGWNDRDLKARFYFYAMWAGTALVIVPMLAWLAMLIALFTETRIRALGMVIAVVVVWFVVPGGIARSLTARGPLLYWDETNGQNISPATAAFGLAGLRTYIRHYDGRSYHLSEYPSSTDTALAFAYYFGLHAALAVAFRAAAIRRAREVWRP